MLKFNTEPYNDDFSEDNKFYRILFRPSFAVQARELTQLQTILQNQISRQGQHTFKQGAMVIPGQVSIDTEADYVKLTATYGTASTEAFIFDLVGKTILGGSTGIKAQIIKAIPSSGLEPCTIYVRYLSTGTTNGVIDSAKKTFVNGEVLSTLYPADGSYSFQAVSSAATGTGSIATIERGVYYVNGHFVLCADPVTAGAQTLILDKYTNTPSYRIGLQVVETTVIPEDDETLLDNAQSSYNYAAPGAHRYHIDLILAKKSLTTEDDENFIELLRVGSGTIQRIVDKTEYSELEKTFARRTMDESGNYDVRPFTVDVREARSNNRGQWVSGNSYYYGDIVSNAGKTYTMIKSSASSATDGSFASGSTAPTHTFRTGEEMSDGQRGPQKTDGLIVWEYTETPKYNRGISVDGSDDNLTLAFAPGKAYVQGFEIEKVSTSYLNVPKARDTKHQVSVDNALIPSTVGNYVFVTGLNNAPRVSTFETVALYDKATIAPVVILTGTITTTTSSTAVTGSSTLFNTQLTETALLYTQYGAFIGQVASITDDTHLTLTANATIALTAATIKRDGRGTAVGTQVGTARVRFIELDNGTYGSVTAQYKISLFDVKMNTGYDFSQNVKSFYYNDSAGGFALDFTADILPLTSTIQGGVISSAAKTISTGTITTTTSSATVTGTSTTFITSGVLQGHNIYTSAGVYIGTVASTPTSETSLTLTANAATALTTSSNWIIGGLVSGSNTRFGEQLVVGDYVSMGSSAAYPFATIRRVTNIWGQNSITVDAPISVGNATTGASEGVQLVYTELKETGNEPLVFLFPYYSIKEISGGQITYSTYESKQTLTGSRSGSICTVGVNNASATYLPASQTNNYQLIDNTTGLSVPFDASLPITTPRTAGSVEISGGSATFYLDAKYENRSFTIISAISKTLTSGTQKSKGISQVQRLTFTTQAAVQAAALSLGVADVFRIISVKQATGYAYGSTPAASAYVDDVSDFYDFDDGQTVSYYGISKLKLKSSYSPPSAPVEVIFQYFQHTGSGDYFTVGSYTSINYKDIPVFQGVSLRDAIDFRPRIDSTGTNFTGTDVSLSLVPKRGSSVEVDFKYYLPRIDKIALDSNGKFFDIQGVPDLNPATPNDPTLGMVLYRLTFEPYTFGTASTNIKAIKQENKRYTMRDIGKLEQRINTLEYYTSLSMLEQETQTLDIRDSQTGLNRYKNGFIVDNFSGHSVGDVLNPNYLCSIDMASNELRPFYTMKNINLVENATVTTSRSSKNYALLGDLITIKLDATTPHLPLVTQPYASRVENINPFAIFTFLGTITMNPSSDEWFEVERRPDIIINQEGDFDTVSILAEKAGVLGTVWNAWQTQWTGEPVMTDVQRFEGDRRWDGGAYLNSLFGNVESGHGWAHRVVTAAVVATQIGQSRSGINTKVVAKIDTQLTQDRVLSTAVIPYIRSRYVLIQVKGLKPSSKFYPFFDGVDVSAYCTPATRITYTNQTSMFDDHSAVGTKTTDAERRINNDTQICLNKGEILKNTTSGVTGTGIVVGTEKIYDNAGSVTERAVYLLNVNGSFANGNTVLGDISALTATVNTVQTTQVAGDSLITNAAGELNFLFYIESNDNLRFRTGTKEFVLTDVPYNDITYTSKARQNYYAMGILETKQATYTSTRNAVLVKEQVSENQTITQTTARVVSDTGWYDPLAQTFQVKTSGGGGCFLTKIDVFFASKDRNIPVNLEIREVVNGYPGKNILPFSQVTLKPEDVHLTVDGLTEGTQAYKDACVQMEDKSGNLIDVSSYNTPTTFNFPSPVYVKENGEYAIVLASDSNGYNVWISNMGDKIPNSSRMISEQPYAGVLFKSQNGSTWTANQDQDLKFTLYRAKFATGVTANVEFINDALPKVVLDKDPFETNVGSNKVKVYHSNHGFSTADSVNIWNENLDEVYGPVSSGTISPDTASTEVVGSGTLFNTEIPALLAGTLIYTVGGTLIGKVSSVTSNSQIVLTSVAAINGTNIQYRIAPSINGIPVNEIYNSPSHDVVANPAHAVVAVVDADSYVITTTSNATVRGYSGGLTVKADQQIVYNAVQPVAQMQTFSDTTSQFLIQTRSGRSISGSETVMVDSGEQGIVVNENNYFAAPQVVTSEENDPVGQERSLKLHAVMNTTNDALSPVLDTHRISAITISNKINTPTETTVNQAGLDEISLVSSNTTIGFTAETTTGAKNAIMYSTNSTVRALFQNIVVGKYIFISGAADSANNGKFLVTKVSDNGTTASVTLYTAGVTRAAGSSTTVVVKNHFIDEIAPTGSSTHSQYMTKKVTLATPATTLKVKLACNVPTKSNLLVYYKVSTVGSKDAFSTVNWKLISPDSSIVKVGYGSPTFTDVDYTLNNLSPFDAVTVKLVFQSTNSSEIPRVKDLRVIACS